MAELQVDLNADLGESFGVWTLGDDAGVLDVISSANLACGFHAGDPLTIARSVAAALDRGIRIGAQVSYPDLVGFGRRQMDVEPEQLTADVLYQIGALDGFCRSHGARVSYVKPHGALYNRILTDETQAAAVVDAVRSWHEDLPLMTLNGSAAAAVATAANVQVINEGYADRAYTDEGRLVARSDPGAVLDDADQVAQRAVRMVVEQRVTTATGTDLPIAVESLCLHGDTPGAATLAREIRRRLQDAGVTIASP